MIRVYCLYRVSTIGQVRKNDIPMQRQACRDLPQKRDGRSWKNFLKEEFPATSNLLNSVRALQEINALRFKNGFDVLLVFMFDRLGRRDDETPLRGGVVRQKRSESLERGRRRTAV